MQDLLVIKDGQAIVQCGENSYTDTFENFIADGGLSLPVGVTTIDYNKATKSCWINGKAFQTFPNEYAEQVLTLAPVLCESFEARKKEREEAEHAEYVKSEEARYKAEYEKERQESGYYEFENCQARALTQLNADFEDIKEQAHVKSSLGFEVDANQTANENVNGLLITIGEGSCQFCDYENQFHELNKSQLETLQLEIIANAQSLYAQKWQYRTAIEQCQDNEELERIVASIKFTYMDFTQTQE